MKTIGVLGGLGPQATDDFLARLHRAANRMIEPRFNSGYPPMVVHYHRRPPVVMADARTPKLPMEVDGSILEAVAWLGTWADFLVIPANAPHLFAEEIETAAGKSLLNMVVLALAEAARRGWTRAGVLGFGDARVPVYTGRGTSMVWEVIDRGLQAGVSDAVIRCQEGRAGDEQRQAVEEAVSQLRARAVDGIILGCTELPLILGEKAEADDLLNPAELLAEAAVRRAMG